MSEGDSALPPKQARSRATRERLLAAGRELLDHAALEETSIADVAHRADCSVGAFYQRFPDKQAFFAAVVEAVLADIIADARRFTADPDLSGATIEVALAKSINYWAETFRRYRGLFRTVMKKTLHAEQDWRPISDAGLVAVEPFIAMLTIKYTKSDDTSFRYRVLVAFQIVFGVMLNASLHQTVLLNLDSDELVAWANEVARHCLFGEFPDALLEFGSTMRSARRRRDWRPRNRSN